MAARRRELTQCHGGRLGVVATSLASLRAVAEAGIKVCSRMAEAGIRECSRLEKEEEEKVTQVDEVVDVP